MLKRNIVLGVFLTVVIIMSGMQRLQAAETQVGSMHVEVIVDGQLEGTTDLLKNTTSKELEQYMPTGKFILPINFVLIRRGPNVTLIDTGLGEKVATELAQRGIAPNMVSDILLTHMHYDHIDGLMLEGRALFPKATLHIAENEMAFWNDASNKDKFVTSRTQLVDAMFIKSHEVMKAYKGRIKPFSPRALKDEQNDLLPGIDAIAAYGHTPGHTVYRLHDAGKQFFVLGDTVHAGVMQYPRPEVSFEFDIDPDQAAKTRHEFFQYLSEQGIASTGMHEPEPQIGVLKPHPKKPHGFLFLPVQ